jgi:hypothetical protein
MLYICYIVMAGGWLVIIMITQITISSSILVFGSCYVPATTIISYLHQLIELQLIGNY